MKKPYTAIALLSLIFITLSCVEEVETKQQQVTISFTLSADHQITSDLSQDARLVLRVESQSGEGVIEFEEVDFQYRENRFLTSPLDLPFGTYTITDFLLLNENDDIIYAVPKSSGALARLVSDPLDYNFTYTPSPDTPSINLSLLGTRNHTAGDFGYSSFKKPGWRLSLTVEVKDGGTPTSAAAIILNGNDTVYHTTLRAKMNHITLPVTLDENLRLVIAKEGYAPVHFLLTGLVRTQGKKPLKVILDPAFTIVAYIDHASSPMFDFYLGGPEGTSVTIDWGDGATEAIELSGDVEITHPYAANGNYPIIITGEIENINYFYSFYGQGMIDAIDFRHLAALREIRFGLTRSPGTIDLSHNIDLEFVMLSGLENMEALYLPEHHRISQLLIEGPNLLSTADVDSVINNVYNNTVQENIMNGTMGIQAIWYDDDEALLGPPSAAAMTQLQSLKENYAWTIFPDPFD